MEILDDPVQPSASELLTVTVLDTANSAVTREVNGMVGGSST